MAKDVARDNDSQFLQLIPMHALSAHALKRGSLTIVIQYARPKSKDARIASVSPELKTGSAPAPLPASLVLRAEYRLTRTKLSTNTKKTFPLYHRTFINRCVPLPSRGRILTNCSTAQTITTHNTCALRLCKPSISYDICTVLLAFRPVLFCFDSRPHPKTGDKSSKLLHSVQPLLCPETAASLYITGKSRSSILKASKRGWFPNLFVVLETSHVVDAQSIRIFVHATRMGPTAGVYKKQTFNCQSGNIKLPDKS